VSERQHHIIHSLKYEVLFEGSRPSDQQNALSGIHFGTVQDLLQRFFDSFIEKDHYLRINTLELDLGIIPSNNWKGNFVNRLENVLYDKLDRVLLSKKDTLLFSADQKNDKMPDISLFTAEERDEDILLSFLQKGYLSWIYGESGLLIINAVFENILNRRSESFEPRLLHLLKHSEVSLKRFVAQIDPRLQSIWLKKYFHGAGLLSDAIFTYQRLMLSQQEISGTLINKICLWLGAQLVSYILKHDQEAFTSKVFLDKHSDEFLKVFHSDLMKTVKPETLKPAEDPENIISQFLITSLLTFKKEPGRFITTDRQESEVIFREDMKNGENIREKEDLSLGLFPENSGLVLLWPYLQTLFSRFHLMKEDQFRGIEEKTRALYMLHYLATGTLNAEEHQLLVPKILIAYDLDLPVPLYCELDDTVREECDQLLENLTKHWSALKSTSPGGLRRTFLQRHALIKFKDYGWHFIFERQGVDVLIDRLPYPLSVIKLKWLENPVYVLW